MSVLFGTHHRCAALRALTKALPWEGLCLFQHPLQFASRVPR